MVTKLIDESVEYSASEFIPFESEMQQAPALMRTSVLEPNLYYPEETKQTSECNPSTNKACYYSKVQEFLLNEDLYCNKLF